MECPHCHGALPSKECPECGEQIPLVGKFCCFCASALVEDDAIEAADDNGGDDFAERVLCSDGTCIGVINKDGVCSECGKPYSGDTE